MNKYNGLVSFQTHHRRLWHISSICNCHGSSACLMVQIMKYDWERMVLFIHLFLSEPPSSHIFFRKLKNEGVEQKLEGEEVQEIEQETNTYSIYTPFYLQCIIHIQ